MDEILILIREEIAQVREEVKTLDSKFDKLSVVVAGIKAQGLILGAVSGSIFSAIVAIVIKKF